MSGLLGGWRRSFGLPVRVGGCQEQNMNIKYALVVRKQQKWVSIMKPPSHRRRAEPYYKVQYHDGVTLSWKDRRKEAFDTFDEALSFLQQNKGREALRIVEFNAGRSETVHEQR